MKNLLELLIVAFLPAIRAMNVPSYIQRLRYTTMPGIRGLFLVPIILLNACSDRTSIVSNDLAGLRAIVKIDMPINSGRWEIFATPEDTGMLPGSNDFTTLVAELQLSDKSAFNEYKEPTGATYIAPAAARPWINKAFQTMLKQNENSRADLSSNYDCRKYATTITKSGRPVEGFICADQERALLYLTLSINENPEEAKK